MKNTSRNNIEKKSLTNEEFDKVSDQIKHLHEKKQKVSDQIKHLQGYLSCLQQDGEGDTTQVNSVGYQ